MKVVDGLAGGDETQLEGAADGVDEEGEGAGSTDESCEGFGREGEREGAVLGRVRDRSGAARTRKAPSHSSRAFHVSGSQSASSQDLVRSRPSHEAGGSVPPIQENQRPPWFKSPFQIDDLSSLSNGRAGLLRSESEAPGCPER